MADSLTSYVPTVRNTSKLVSTGVVTVFCCDTSASGPLSISNTNVAGSPVKPTTVLTISILPLCWFTNSQSTV